MSRTKSCVSSPTTDRLTDIPGVGAKTAAVIVEALNGETPQYLVKLLNDIPQPGSDEGEALRARLKGDLHVHSDWSDGGDTIEAMADEGAGPRARVLRPDRPLAPA